MKDCNPDIAKLKTLGRCRSVINIKNEKSKDKDYKVKKSELPGPGAHKEMEKGFNMTMPRSPVIKFKCDKRIIFAEQVAIRKKFVPAPDAYGFKDFKENKVWKHLTTKR